MCFLSRRAVVYRLLNLDLASRVRFIPSPSHTAAAVCISESLHPCVPPSATACLTLVRYAKALCVAASLVLAILIAVCHCDVLCILPLGLLQLYSDGESQRPHVDALTPRDGYICCVHETLATVVEHIFTKSPGIKDDPVVLQRCHDALKRIYAFAGTARQKGKERPCVAMSIRYPADDDRPPQRARRAREGVLMICIMGTFGGKPFDALDAVYQHFCIAVAPNRLPRRVGEDGSGETCAFRDELHVCPRPWTHPSQWIVAYEYRSPSALCSTWPPVSKRGERSRNGAPGGDSATEPAYWLDDEQLDWFRAKCAERMEAWSAMCTADPDFALACEREFRENRFMTSQSSLASRTSWGSFNTRGTRSRPGTPLAAVPEGIPGGSPAASPRPESPRSCRGRSTKEKSWRRRSFSGSAKSLHASLRKAAAMTKAS